jgi:hypothetical protein
MAMHAEWAKQNILNDVLKQSLLKADVSSPTAHEDYRYRSTSLTYAPLGASKTNKYIKVSIPSPMQP